jgi:hypothetical protein
VVLVVEQMMLPLVLAATVDGRGVALVAGVQVWTRAQQQPGVQVPTVSSW